MKKCITIIILAALITISGCAPNTSQSVENTANSIGQPTPNINENSEGAEDKENILVIKDKISPSYPIYSFEFAYYDELDDVKTQSPYHAVPAVYESH